MEEERVFIVLSLDSDGIQHLIATEDLEKALAGYEEMMLSHGNAQANDGLIEAMNLHLKMRRQ